MQLRCEHPMNNTSAWMSRRSAVVSQTLVIVITLRLWPFATFEFKSTGISSLNGGCTAQVRFTSVSIPRCHRRNVEHYHRNPQVNHLLTVVTVHLQQAHCNFPDKRKSWSSCRPRHELCKPVLPPIEWLRIQQTRLAWNT